MAIENTYLLGKNITLGCGFDLQAKAPLDSRQTVPAFAGLQALITGNAAYEGMIVYDEETKKTYQAQLVDDVLAFREFGINEAELKNLIASETTAAMEFKGVATALPENPSKGDMYKVTASFDIIEGETAKIGDSIVYDGTQWFIIPSGDDIEDTWRPVTGVDNDSTLTFAAGDKLEKSVAANGTITYKHVAIDAPVNQNSDEDEPTRTYITQLITDNHGHVIGFKTATENVEDTNTTYEFEGQAEESGVYFQVTASEEGATAEVVYLDAYNKNEVDAKFAAAKTETANQDAVVLAEAQAYADGKDAAIEAAQKAADDITDYVGTFTHATAKTVVDYVNAKTDGIATSGNLEALAGRVTAAEGEIDALQEASAKHVEKEEGKSLILDTEITRLAGMSDGANKVEKSVTNGNIKIDGEEVVVYTHPDKHSIDDVTGLQDALNGLQAKGDYAAEEHTHTKDEITDFAHTHTASEITNLDETIKGYDYATKTELGEVDAKFANYKTSADQKAIDDEQNRRLGVIEGDYLKAADIANFETKENVKKVADDLAAETKARTEADAGFETRIAALEGNFGDGEGTVEAQIAAAVAAEKQRAEGIEGGLRTDVNAVAGRMDTAEGKITALEDESAKHAIKTEVESALALKADKSVVDAMYTNSQIDTAVQGAKDYAKGLVDAIPEQTDYTVTITSNTDDATVAKTYVFSQCGAEIGSIKLAKDLVVTAGSVKEVETADAPYAGAKVGEKYIELVIANQETPIYVPAKDLVDIYTAKDGAAEVQVAISNTNEISATLVNGGITEEKLAAGIKTKLNKTWEEVGVAKGLVDALADGQVKANKEAIENITKTNGLIAAAKAEAISAAETKAGELDTALHTVISKEIDDDVKAAIDAEVTRADNKYETKGTAQGIVDGLKLSETYEPKGAEARAIAAAKTETENQVKALADNVYTKTETYTKSEVDALLTWGSF